MFKTIGLFAGGWGGVEVDGDDNIYVGYIIAGKIWVFIPEGGNPIREIPSLEYEPRDICPLSLRSQLVISDGSAIRVINKDAW